MKRIFIVVSFLLFGLSLLVSAHPGKTDENGGHYNRATDEYHFHHGYEEHQHTDGTCPYEFEDNVSVASSDRYSEGVQDGKSNSYSKGYNEGFDEGMLYALRDNGGSILGLLLIGSLIGAGLMRWADSAQVHDLRAQLKNATKTAEYQKRNPK